MMRFTTIADVEGWAACMRRLGETRTTNCPSFLRPYHFVLMGLQLRSMGPGNLTLPSSMSSYAARMRLWECIDQTPPISVKGNPAPERFCPMRRLRTRDNVGDLAEILAQIVRHQSKGCDEETYQSVFSMLSELMDNAFAHSGNADATRGLVCAQTWKSGNLAQIAIADSGMGIRPSFEQSTRWAERVKLRNACELATEYGVTSKLYGHSGYGLTLVRGLAELCDGNVVIMSQREVFQASKGKAASRTNVFSLWQGALVIFEWRVSQQLDTAAVYATWPDSEEDGVI